MSSSSRIHIPFDAIENHIHCSICLSAIRGAVLTPCGHRYCSRCINEWVGRNHTCPCCNSALNASQFYYDVQYDSFIDEVLLQRDKAEQACFDKMFGQDATENQSKSPFEEILKKHMKSSLLSHQRYFNKLHEDYQRKIHLLDMGMTQGALEGEVSQDGENKETLKETLLKKLEESEKLAADAFDRYLTANVPSLEVLPVDVSVYIPDKGVRISSITIKPADSLTVIKPHVEAAMLEKCDDIISWSDDGGVRLLFGPLSRSNQYNLEEVLSNVDNMDDVHAISWDSRPIFQHNMRPGSEIVLQGVFKSQSDLPRRCFVNIFKETGAEKVDYFSCNECKVKWICKSCIQSCHKDHNVAPFVMNHIPTWACCYCPKKKLCKIQDK